MDRRDLLALAGTAGLAATGGCLGHRVVDEETVRDRKVRIAELEATLEARERRIEELEREMAGLEDRLDRLRRRSRGPRVNLVGLVREWRRLGDVVHRRVGYVPAAGTAVLAVNYTYPVHGTTFDSTTGRVDATVQVEIQGERDIPTAQVGREVRSLVDRDRRLGELPIRFDAGALSPGSYVATARVTDRVTDITSEPVTAIFRVTPNADGGTGGDSSSEDSGSGSGDGSGDSGSNSSDEPGADVGRRGDTGRVPDGR